MHGISGCIQIPLKVFVDIWFIFILKLSSKGNYQLNTNNNLI